MSERASTFLLKLFIFAIGPSFLIDNSFAKALYSVIRLLFRFLPKYSDGAHFVMCLIYLACVTVLYLRYYVKIEQLLEKFIASVNRAMAGAMFTMSAIATDGSAKGEHDRQVEAVMHVIHDIIQECFGTIDGRLVLFVANTTMSDQLNVAKFYPKQPSKMSIPKLSYAGKAFTEGLVILRYAYFLKFGGSKKLAIPRRNYAVLDQDESNRFFLCIYSRVTIGDGLSNQAITGVFSFDCAEPHHLSKARRYSDDVERALTPICQCALYHYYHSTKP